MKPEATAPQNDGEDMLEMALRIAQEMRDEPQMDLEESIESTPINPPGKPRWNVTDHGGAKMKWQFLILVGGFLLSV